MATEPQNGRRWRNRIVGHGEEDPTQLLANPFNWRIHSWYQEQVLAGVIDEIGLIDEVTVNQRTGHMIDGHLRNAMAIREEQPTIPVKYVDLEPHEEALALATYDPISRMAGTDEELLEELLEGVDTNNEHVEQMLAELVGETSEGVGDGIADGFNPPVNSRIAYRVVVEGMEHEEAEMVRDELDGLYPHNKVRVETYRPPEA